MSAPPPRAVRTWRVRVISPDGQRDTGSLTSVVVEEDPTPQAIADALAEIVWRIAHDLASQDPAEESP